MFKKFLMRAFELIQQHIQECIHDGLDQKFVQQNSKILEGMMWPKYCRILYVELIILPFLILKANFEDCHYNSHPDTICLYLFYLSMVISATVDKLLQKLKPRFDRISLMRIMILLIEATSGAFVAEMEMRLKSDICYKQSMLQISFFLIIVRNIKLRIFLIAKYFIYRGIRNELSLPDSAVGYHNIILLILILRCLDVQFIQLVKMIHLCKVSFKSVPSAVCILSANCENVFFKNNFMKRMVSSKHRDLTKLDVSQSPPLDLTQMKSDILPVDDDRLLDFISHLYIDLDDAKSYIPSLDLKQQKRAVENNNLLKSEEILLNLVYLLQQITNLDKKSQKKTYNFRCFYAQDDDLQSVEKNESRLKVIIEVRIKTCLQYENACDAIMINFLDISTHLKKVYYKKMNLFKSKVIKSISHELRTRLNVIQGMVQILQTDHQLDDKIQKILTTTFNNCRIQKYIIESIINYNLLMESKIPLKKEKCKINDIISDVISLFREEAEAKQTKIQFNKDKNDQNWYDIDADKVKSVLIHLLSNSIKHTKKGRITIRVHRDVNSVGFLKSIKSYSSLPYKLQRSSELSANLSVQGSKRAKIVTIERHNPLDLGVVSQQSIFAAKCQSQESEQYLQIEIKDTGSGIEPEKLKFIREMLLDDDHGNNAQISDIASGVMIGLRASNQIARYLNNTPDNCSCLRIDSNHLLGTTVTLTLKLKSLGIDNTQQPYYQQDSLIESEAPLQPIQKMVRLSVSSPYMENQPLVTLGEISQLESTVCHCGQDILIVDDEPYNLIVLESLLRKLNQQVIKADDGKDAIEIMVKRFDDSKIHKCKSIRAIIMDYQMPIINGEDAAKQILQICHDCGLPPIPIFGLTGFSGEEDIQRLLQAGMVDVYVKPITMATLEDILSKLQRSEFRSGDLMNSNVSQAFQCIEANNDDPEQFEDIFSNIHNSQYNSQDLMNSLSIMYSGKV